MFITSYLCFAPSQLTDVKNHSLTSTSLCMWVCHQTLKIPSKMHSCVTKGFWQNWNMIDMMRYQILRQIGDGTYGQVVLAQNKQSGEKVAIKRYLSWIINNLVCVGGGSGWGGGFEWKEVKGHLKILQEQELILENHWCCYVFGVILTKVQRVSWRP